LRPNAKVIGAAPRFTAQPVFRARTETAAWRQVAPSQIPSVIARSQSLHNVVVVYVLKTPLDFVFLFGLWVRRLVVTFLFDFGSAGFLGLGQQHRSW
jgi:hypothetical protein